MDLQIVKWSIFIFFMIFLFAFLKEIFSRKRTDGDLEFIIRNEINRIKNMDGFEFEDYCARLLKEMGYRGVKVTPRSNDCGRDIECYNQNGERVFVECKHYRDKLINRELILKLLGSSSNYGGDNCRSLFITTSGYNRTAREMRNRKLELWDMNDIKEILRKIR